MPAILQIPEITTTWEEIKNEFVRLWVYARRGKQSKKEELRNEFDFTIGNSE